VSVAYNLIDEQWIPVERASGKVEMIAPAQVVEREDPPLRIASPRPDFDGALLEFLIGLLQTAAAPETEHAWEDDFKKPPSVKAMRARFETVREAFFLDGDGPRFMQDLTVTNDPKASAEPIGALLIDRIGESGLAQSPTLFAKPGLVEALGYPAAAAALMTLQGYAPAGGRGQLTSLRGGGPLTTVISSDDLWTTAWSNVLPRPEFEARVPGDSSRSSPEAMFPWMGRTRSSESSGGRATLPEDVHPLQHLWGLPRRVRLVIEDADTGTCSLSGASGVRVVRAYVNRPDGTSYEGDYRHPWTPYSLLKPNEPWNPKKGDKEGLPYRDWPLLVTGTATRRPATVLGYLAATRRREVVPRPRLTAFGYAMENMKPLRWGRAETPLITIIPGLADAFSVEVDAIVGASEEMRKTLSSQVKGAWSDRPADLDVFGRLNPAFWSATESAFFAAVRAVKASLENDDDAKAREAKETWLEELHRSALAIFDVFVEASAEVAAPGLRRAVLARRNLQQFTHPSSRKLRKLLGLTVDEAPKPGKKRKASKKKESSP
jgi:CRISPR system Cascade subunit CasA